MSAPFHTIRDVNDGYSLTILNGDVVESLSLVSGGAPARYGDRTGAVLDVQTREGNRDEFSGPGQPGRLRRLRHARGSARAGEEVVLAPVRAEELSRLRAGPARRGVGHRRSATTTSPRAWPITRRPSRPSASPSLHGRSKWKDRTKASPRRRARRPDPISASCNGAATPRPGAPPSRPSRRARPASTSTRTAERPSSRSPSQGGLRTDVCAWTGGAPARRRACSSAGSDERATARDFNGRTHLVTEDYDAKRRAVGRLPAGHLVTVGEPPQPDPRRPLRPFGTRRARAASLRARPRPSSSAPRTRLIAAYGDYAQFPGFAQLYGRHGNPDLEAERSRHFTLGLEQRLGAHTRVRVDAYDQEEDGLLYSRDAEWRLEDGRIVVPQLSRPPRQRRSRGRSRGVEVLLQRRSANGLSGWIAYSYGPRAGTTRRRASPSIPTSTSATP